MNKLSLVGMQLPEKYKENFDVSSEGRCLDEEEAVLVCDPDILCQSSLQSRCFVWEARLTLIFYSRFCRRWKVSYFVARFVILLSSSTAKG